MCGINEHKYVYDNIAHLCLYMDKKYKLFNNIFEVNHKLKKNWLVQKSFRVKNKTKLGHYYIFLSSQLFLKQQTILWNFIIN